jgi:hypothetical protein
MTDNVISLNILTKLPIEPDKVLESAKGRLSEVLVLGWHDGKFYMAASDPDMSRAAMLLLKALNVVTDAT